MSAYSDNFALIDWSGFRPTPPAKRERRGKSTMVMPDIAEFVSPVDYSLISSRSQLRAHERRHGVRQCGELKNAADFNPYTAKSVTNEKALERSYRQALEKTGWT